MISIIVPVYKAEQYIHRCIDSILAQSHADFELLLVDDGSPDDCGAICDEYAAKDTRIRVFHKENGGVSSARNFGVDNAKGEWIAFIDADDYVHPDFLASLYAQHDADFIVGSFQIVGSDEIWDVLLNDHLYDKSSLKENVFTLLMKINFQTPWGKLFNFELLRTHHLRFDEKMIANEDFLFVMNYLLHIESLRTCASPYYFYERGNVNGLSQNSRYFDEYFYGMDAFESATNALTQVFGDVLKHMYNICVRAFCIRQCSYIYHSNEGIVAKLKKLRQMSRNRHLNTFFTTKEVYWRMRKRTELFHFLMSKRLLVSAYIYIHILKGKVYE